MGEIPARQAILTAVHLRRPPASGDQRTTLVKLHLAAETARRGQKANTRMIARGCAGLQRRYVQKAVHPSDDIAVDRAHVRARATTGTNPATPTLSGP